MQRTHILRSALAVVSLEVRQILQGKKIFAVGFLIACAVFLGFVVRRWGEMPQGDAWHYIYMFMMNFLFLQALVILVPLLFATSLIREEVDEGTLVYLFTRPLPKPVVLLAKYLAACRRSSSSDKFPAGCCTAISPVRCHCACWMAPFPL